MHKFHTLLCAALLTLSAPAFAQVEGHDSLIPTQIFMTIDSDAQNQLYDALAKANKNIFIYAQEFSSPVLLTKLVEAKKRGIDVEIVLPASAFKVKGNLIAKAEKAGIPVWRDKQHTDNPAGRLITVDGYKAFTGTFTLVDDAKRKGIENLVQLESETLASTYEGDWEDHRTHSDPFGKSAKKRLKELIKAEAERPKTRLEEVMEIQKKEMQAAREARDAYDRAMKR